MVAAGVQLACICTFPGLMHRLGLRCMSSPGAWCETDEIRHLGLPWTINGIASDARRECTGGATITVDLHLDAGLRQTVGEILEPDDAGSNHQDATMAMAERGAS